MSYESDDDRPRRRRPRRKSRRRRGPGAGVWVSLAVVGVLLVAAVVVAVVLSRRGETAGTGPAAGAAFPAGPGGATAPAAREITAEEFQAIKKEDTLASLESRFGPARRLGPAELDGMYLNMVNNGHDARLKISFGTRLRKTYNLANPECYLWSAGHTKVYLIPAEGHPAATWHLKWYHHSGTNSTIEHNLLNDGKPPPLGK
ncbi:MAG: hypothetical protein C0501_06430 [Isosphaera sp.]|nr:hypothetical protein [Isosphaera sp.]